MSGIDDFEELGELEDLSTPEHQEPVAQLATLLEDVPETLGQRIRWRIQRRLLARDVSEFSFLHVFGVFMEFVKVLFESLQGTHQKRGEDE